MRSVKYPASRRVKDRRKASYALLSKISKDLEFLKGKGYCYGCGRAETKR